MSYVCRISAYSGTSGSLFHVFKYKKKTEFNGEQEKESIIFVRMRKKKSIPRDQRLSSLGKPRDANQ